MPKGKQLDFCERKFILRMRDEDYLQSEIVASVQRSKGAVYRVLKDHAKEGPLARSGLPPTISPIYKRHSVREARKQENTARELNQCVVAPISVQQNWHYL